MDNGSEKPYEARRQGSGRGSLLVWVAALLAALLLFYFLNHLVMSLQGLPLGWDLTVAG